MSEITNTSLAPWYGAKRTLAPRIVAELGPHRAYCEPFCGSMAVLLAKPAASMEIANDLHGDLINLARVVASPWWIELLERIERTLMSSELYLEARTEVLVPLADPAPSIRAVGPEHVERAYWYLVSSWQGRNGVSGTHMHNQHLARRFTAGGGHGPTRWAGVAKSIRGWHDRLKSVTIERTDAFELLAKLDNAPEWAVYVDPPYVEKSDRYVHDFDADDHRKLRDALSRFDQARVVVSYYEHPTLRDLYQGWTFVSCPTTKAMVSAGQRDKGGAVKAPEILIINGPSLTIAKEGGLFA